MLYIVAASLWTPAVCVDEITPLTIFEIELRTDGTIKTRYGIGNTDLLPTVGIGGGDHDGYVIASHTKEEEPGISLDSAGEVNLYTAHSVEFVRSHRAPSGT